MSGMERGDGAQRGGLTGRLRALFEASFFRFLLVGVANTLFGGAVMFALYHWAGWSYWLSSAMNYVCGSVLSYFLNKRFTFRDAGRGAASVLRFAVNITVCYLLSYGLARAALRALLAGAEEKLRDSAAMLAGMCLFVALNYLGQRFLVFRGGDGKAPGGE